MIYDSERWMSDLDDVVEGLPQLHELEGASVMVTGAAGLVCSAVVDVLIAYNELHANVINILLAGRAAREMSDRFGQYLNRDYVSYVPYDAARSDNELPRCDYAIHGASNAFPGMIAKEPVETMLGNVLGVDGLLRHAVSCGTRRVLYISSSEVYGNGGGAEPIREDEYGYIDLLNPRSSYSMGKRAAETLCSSYASEHGADVVVVRPGHIYGPTASPADNRVASAWAWAAARGEDIVMKSDGAQVRSYCHCLDCASALLTVLLRGEASTAYNISNPDSVMSIRVLAELLSEVGGVHLMRELPSDDERRAFNPMANSSLNSARLEALGWSGLFPARDGVDNTVMVMKDMLQEGA